MLCWIRRKKYFPYNLFGGESCSVVIGLYAWASYIPIQRFFYYFVLRSFKDLLFDTAQKMKFFITDFFSKCDQIRRFLRIWSHLLKKSVIETFIFFVSVRDLSIILFPGPPFYCFRPHPHICYNYVRHNHLRFKMMGEASFET